MISSARARNASLRQMKQAALKGESVPSGLEQGPLDQRSKELRKQCVRCLLGGSRGHLGSTFSLIEILRILYDDVLKYDPANPSWEERDRFILSKGHGCIALYVLLAEKGFFPDAELDKFCHPDGILGGHPDHVKVPGIEASTGSLGHGLSIGIGRALAGRTRGADWRVFVTLGDGECNEGSIWEGALAAGNHGLENLTVIVDNNKRQSYGSTDEVLDLEPFADKWRAFGFGVHEVDGHDTNALRDAFARLPYEKDRPSALICHTVKGKGIPEAEGNNKWHHLRAIDEAKAQSMIDAIEAY